MTRTDRPGGYGTLDAIVRDLLKDAAGDPERAEALARKYVIGEEHTRRVIDAIWDAVGDEEAR